VSKRQKPISKKFWWDEIYGKLKRLPCVLERLYWKRKIKRGDYD